MFALKNLFPATFDRIPVWRPYFFLKSDQLPFVSNYDLQKWWQLAIRFNTIVLLKAIVLFNSIYFSASLECVNFCILLSKCVTILLLVIYFLIPLKCIAVLGQNFSIKLLSYLIIILRDSLTVGYYPQRFAYKNCCWFIFCLLVITHKLQKIVYLSNR